MKDPLAGALKLGQVEGKAQAKAREEAQRREQWAQAAREQVERERPAREYVAGQVQQRTRRVRVKHAETPDGKAHYEKIVELRCPDCGTWERSWYSLTVNHGWSETNWPANAGCRAQSLEKQKDLRPFKASTDAVGCGPLREPWTTAKRFYVMEQFMYHRDVLLAWSRKWAPLSQARVGTPDDRQEEVA